MSRLPVIDPQKGGDGPNYDHQRKEEEALWQLRDGYG